MNGLNNFNSIYFIVLKSLTIAMAFYVQSLILNVKCLMLNIKYSILYSPFERYHPFGAIEDKTIRNYFAKISAPTELFGYDYRLLIFTFELI